MRARYLVGCLIIIIGLLVLTGIKPYDRATWLMEVAPVLVAAPILILSYRKFPLTSLLYFLFGAAWPAAYVQVGNEVI